MRFARAGSGFDSAIIVFLDRFIVINVLLAVFNLMPLPPLDGSRLLTIFLPPQRQNIIYFLDKYGFFILIAVLFFPPGDPIARQVIFPVLDGIYGFLVGV